MPDPPGTHFAPSVRARTFRAEFGAHPDGPARREVAGATDPGTPGHGPTEMELLSRMSPGDQFERRDSASRGDRRILLLSVVLAVALAVFGPHASRAHSAEPSLRWWFPATGWELPPADHGASTETVPAGLADVPDALARELLGPAGGEAGTPVLPLPVPLSAGPGGRPAAKKSGLPAHRPAILRR